MRPRTGVWSNSAAKWGSDPMSEQSFTEADRTDGIEPDMVDRLVNRSKI